MSLTLAELVADRRTLTVTYLGQDVAVVYKPAAYTAEMATRLRAISTTEFLSTIVESWDVLDDDGNQIAVTPETLGSLPVRFLGVVTTAILGDVNLGEAESS